MSGTSRVAHTSLPSLLEAACAVSHHLRNLRTTSPTALLSLMRMLCLLCLLCVLGLLVAVGGHNEQRARRARGRGLPHASRPQVGSSDGGLVPGGCGGEGGFVGGGPRGDGVVAPSVSCLSDAAAAELPNGACNAPAVCDAFTEATAGGRPGVAVQQPWSAEGGNAAILHQMRLRCQAGSCQGATHTPAKPLCWLG